MGLFGNRREWQFRICKLPQNHRQVQRTKGKYALLTEEWMDLGGALKTRSLVEEAGLQVKWLLVG